MFSIIQTNKNPFFFIWLDNDGITHIIVTALHTPRVSRAVWTDRRRSSRLLRVHIFAVPKATNPSHFVCELTSLARVYSGRNSRSLLIRAGPRMREAASRCLCVSLPLGTRDLSCYPPLMLETWPFISLFSLYRSSEVVTAIPRTFSGHTRSWRDIYLFWVKLNAAFVPRLFGDGRADAGGDTLVLVERHLFL